MLTTKQISFVGIMGALSLTIASFNFWLAPRILPGVAIDFTSLPVVIAAFFGGATIGFITGLIAGIIPGIYFGFIGGILGIMGPISLMLGKSISGFTIRIFEK